MISAAVDGVLTRCLYEHGALIFDILGAGQPLVSGERLKILGNRVLSIADEIIEDIAESQNVKYTSMIGFEEF